MDKDLSFELLVDSVQDASVDWDQPFDPKLEIVRMDFSGLVELPKRYRYIVTEALGHIPYIKE